MSTKKKHFTVERHSDNEWRIVNAHIGHGLIYGSRKQARESADKLNIEFEAWLRSDRTINQFRKRPMPKLPDRADG